MSPRRLSKRQKERIENIQERRRARAEARAEAAIIEADARPQQGVVVTRHGATVAVADHQHDVYHCLLRQNIGHLVCGDQVIWQRTGDASGVVTALLDRRSVLERPDYTGRDKPIAANLTQLVVVVAPEPAPTGYLVDQYLVAAETIGVKAMIAVNKADLLGEDDNGRLGNIRGYASIDYPVVRVTARRAGGLDELIGHLRRETSILVGQSGVGKSSLVKTLLPDQDIQIGRLSATTGLGRHTTSAATLYFIPSGGALIDSPGVRSFRLPRMDRASLEHGFREFRAYRGRCQFADCAHDREPGCALREAVARGDIPAWRLESFRHMAQQIQDKRT